MAFGFGFGQFGFGSRQGGGDPTALTAGLLTQIGITIARNEVAQSQTTDAGRYENVAANEPIFARRVYDHGAIRSLLVQEASAALVANSNLVTAAAGWTLTGFDTPEVLSSGPLGGADYTRLVASAANAIAIRPLTSTSGNRASSVRISAGASNTGAVYISDGKPNGTSPYSDDFSSDTSGEWARGAMSVDGVLSVSGGALLYTAGAGDGDFPRYYIEITGLEPDTLHRLTGSIAGTFPIMQLSRDAAGTGAPQHVGAGSFTLENVSTPGGSLFVVLATYPGGGGTTASADVLVLDEIVETLVPASGSVQALVLPEHVAANPRFVIRAEDASDEIFVHDWQHEKKTATVPPLRWFRPQGGTPASMPATVASASIASPPASVDISIAVVAPARADQIAGVFSLNAGDATNVLEIWFNPGVGIEMYYLKASVQISRNVLSAYTAGETYCIDLQQTDDLLRASVNNAAWVVGTDAGMPDWSTAYFGRRTVSDSELQSDIVAVLDRAETVLPVAPHGWNVRELS